MTLGRACGGEAGTPGPQWLGGRRLHTSSFCLGLGQCWLTTRGQCAGRRLPAGAQSGSRHGFLELQRVSQAGAETRAGLQARARREERGSLGLLARVTPGWWCHRMPDTSSVPQGLLPAAGCSLHLICLLHPSGRATLRVQWGCRLEVHLPGALAHAGRLPEVRKGRPLGTSCPELPPGGAQDSAPPGWGPVCPLGQMLLEG